MKRLAPELRLRTRLRSRRYARVATALRVTALFTVAGCAMTGPDVKVLSESPAQIEYSAWCGAQMCISRQNVTAMAEQHCAQNGQGAQLVDAAKVEEDLGRGERFVYKFNCLR
jgi:hypothetical protein